MKSRKPKISINKLAEYMDANATRRKQIVESFKQDIEFKRNYYQVVKTVIPKFFKSYYDVKIIDKALKQVNKKLNSNHLSEWQISDFKNSILALESLKNSERPDLDKYNFIELDNIDQIELSGVIVSIKPDVFLENKKTKKIGAIKVNVTKTENNRLNNKTLTYAATLIKFSLINQGFDENLIDDKACISMDIFNGIYASSPRAYQRRIDALTDACEEFALRWAKY
ncbi:hypothetical protein LLG07_04790 [bacterium]|nr:hypothetical protein [bacterium]